MYRNVTPYGQPLFWFYWTASVSNRNTYDIMISKNKIKRRFTDTSLGTSNMQQGGRLCTTGRHNNMFIYICIFMIYKIRYAHVLFYSTILVMSHGCTSLDHSDIKVYCFTTVKVLMGKRGPVWETVRWKTRCNFGCSETNNRRNQTSNPKFCVTGNSIQYVTVPHESPKTGG